MGPTHHNTNLEPLVTGPRIGLTEQHAKNRRDGYVEREQLRREQRPVGVASRGPAPRLTDMVGRSRNILPRLQQVEEHPRGQHPDGPIRERRQVPVPHTSVSARALTASAPR